jgi:hypothetical protein
LALFVDTTQSQRQGAACGWLPQNIGHLTNAFVVPFRYNDGGIVQ